MTRFLRLRARPIITAIALLGFGILLIAMAGCQTIRDSSQAAGQQSLQTAFNAAKALEVESNPVARAKECAAIEANVVAAGAIMGVTVSTTGAAVTGTSP